MISLLLFWTVYALVVVRVESIVFGSVRQSLTLLYAGYVYYCGILPLLTLLGFNPPLYVNVLGYIFIRAILDFLYEGSVIKSILRSTFSFAWSLPASLILLRYLPFR